MCLRRLGCEASSGASVVSASQLFSIGEGTVVLYTRRCCTALFSLWKDEVRWPTTQERLESKARLQDSAHSFWEDCVGIVDGTFLTFRWRPFTKEVSVQYFNQRKKAYGIQATVMCDDQRRIIHFTALYPGAVHDARAFKSTRLWNNPHNYLSRGQFLLADSAYPLTHWCLIPYKCPRGEQLDAEHKRFNRKLSALRVRIENTIGILKARWAFLKCIPNRGGGDRESLKWYYEWIGAAVVLHNLLIRTDDWKDNEVTQQILERLRRDHEERIEEYGLVNEEENDRHTREALRRDQFFLRFLEEEAEEEDE